MLPWNERLHGVGAQVIMELVHMHEGLVWFPAVAGLVESRPSDVELQGGSSIAVAAVSKDRLNDELLLIVLSYSQQIGADGKVVDMCSDPLAGHQIFDYVNRIRLIRDVWVRVCYRDQQVV